MHIVVKAGEAAKKAVLAKTLPAGATIQWLQDGEAVPDAQIYIDLCYEDTGVFVFAGISPGKYVLVNAVIATGAELPANAIRINGWPGFLENEKIEFAAAGPEGSGAAETILDLLQWKWSVAPDTPGLVSPRIIAMIINEAYYALGEHVSSKAEIDTAMKLGTNYPYGPFEWSEKIGLKKIRTLLQKLAASDKRYTIAPLLEKEAGSTHQPITH